VPGVDLGIFPCRNRSENPPWPRRAYWVVLELCCIDLLRTYLCFVPPETTKCRERLDSRSYLLSLLPGYRKCYVSNIMLNVGEVVLGAVISAFYLILMCFMWPTTETKPIAWILFALSKLRGL
jgi:hypothetical protein